MAPPIVSLLITRYRFHHKQVRAALDAISESGGTIHTFLSGIPNAGYGKLNIRENKKMYGEESEKTLYCPQSAEKPGSVGQLYKSLSLECVSRQVCVNIYAASSYYACLGTWCSSAKRESFNRITQILAVSLTRITVSLTRITAHSIITNFVRVTHIYIVECYENSDTNARTQVRNQII